MKDYLGEVLVGIAAILFPIWWIRTFYRAIFRAKDSTMTPVFNMGGITFVVPILIPIAYFLHLIEPGLTYALMYFPWLRRRRNSERIVAFLELADDLRMRSKGRKNALTVASPRHGSAGESGISGPVA